MTGSAAAAGWPRSFESPVAPLPPVVDVRFFRPPTRRVERVFLHCSASDNVALTGTGLLEEVRAWHRARGFADVGYHFLIDKAGRVICGRDPDTIPAAQKGHNRRSIAIMVHGLASFPAPMLSACRDLCEQINRAMEGRITFHGHCEVAPHKSCPVFAYQPLLELDQFGRMP